MKINKKVLISNFRNMNNYGSAMMGLITIQALITKYGKENIEIYCELDNLESLEYLKKEFCQDIQINNYVRKKKQTKQNRLIRKFSILYDLIFTIKDRDFDEIIVLGGDDISEYYGKYEAALLLFSKWKTSFFSHIILLGQTLGPFDYWWNRLAVRLFLSRLSVYARDKWCVDYLKDNFNIDVTLSVDIAFNDLPMQNNLLLEREVLSSYNITPNQYITIVASGLIDEGYYCSDRCVYIKQHCKVIEYLLGKYSNFDLVLLAHTFPPYGDESKLVNEIYANLTSVQKQRVRIVTEKILPTRARFILGNGLFTITGRMHPAVSTYQMNKPAICLSYSDKYQGVIGESLNRSDLIVNAKNHEDWVSGKIVTLLIEKIEYLFHDYEIVQKQIQEKVKVNKEVIKNCLNKL